MFSNLDQQACGLILNISEQRTYHGEQVLFREGDPGDGLFIVLSGSVRISKRSNTGEEALAIMEAPALFGEMALIDYLPRAADAVANTALEVLFIPLPAFRALLEVNHQMAFTVLYALCGVLTQRLRETNDRLMSIFTLAQWGGGLQSDLLPLP
jgi:CRP-like cAMP-binding protein